MKAFLAIMALALIAVFVVNRPDEGEASGGQDGLTQKIGTHDQVTPSCSGTRHPRRGVRWCRAKRGKSSGPGDR